MIEMNTAAAAVDEPLRSLARERGWALPTWWPGGNLAGELPNSADERMLRAEAVGRLHETGLESEERRKRGAHLTPGGLALELARSLGSEGKAPQSVLDPCCGAGIFLVAAQALSDRPLELHGSDLSEAVLYSVWASMALAFADWQQPPTLHLRQGDGLLLELPRCDSVLTNPPFRSSMRQVGADEKAHFALYRQRWPLGARGRSDLSSAFIEACARSLAPGGLLGIVLPEAQLAADSGLALRRWLCETGAPLRLHHLGAQAFADAQVRTCTLTWRAGTVRGAQFTARSGDQEQSVDLAALAKGGWARHFINPHKPPALKAQHPQVPLESLCDVRRLFTDDFYFVGRALREAEGDSAHKVLTVRHIDPAHHHWGKRAVRVAGTRWQRPELDWKVLRAEDPKRAERLHERWQKSRIILATRGAVIEACRLPQGAVAQVPLIELFCDDEEQASLIYAQLLSPACTAWYLRHHAAMDQTGAGIDLRGAALKQMPLVAAKDWPEKLRRRALDAIGKLESCDEFNAERLLELQRLVGELHAGADEQTLAWWWGRTPKQMSRPDSLCR
jgi:SAM-dependent methyltransferase